MAVRVKIWACALLLASPCANASTVTFHGGAGHVGGSCATVADGNFRMLVDCGAAYSDDSPDRGDPRRACGFAFDPRAYGDLLLTHAHQDHAGRVPELFANGFTGTVWVTPPTRALVEVAWRSQVIYDKCSVRDWRWTRDGRKQGVRVHWRADCEWSRKISPAHLGTLHGVFGELKGCLGATAFASSYPVACSTCQELELKELMGHVKAVPFGEPFACGPFKVTFSPTKHLPGAAAVRIEKGESSCLFSGDLGTLRSHLVKEIPPARKADVVFVESTYGDTTHGTREEIDQDYARFRRVVGETVKAGGVAWVPAFALDRSQRVLLGIQRGIEEGAIPADAPIHYTSPSSRQFMELYVANPGWFDGIPMAPLGTLFSRTRKTFNPKSRRKGGAILMTTSGMMDTGNSLRFAPDLLPQASTTVCLVGYQAPGTTGAQLKDMLEGRSEKKSVIVQDGKTKREIPVAAKVQVFHCFSGHGDAAENDAWLANNRDSRIYLVHGDEKSLRARAEGLRTRFGGAIEVAAPDSPCEF